MLYDTKWDHNARVEATLLRAAEVMEQYGLSRGKLGSTQTGFCLQGAIMFVIVGEPIGEQMSWATIGFGREPSGPLFAECFKHAAEEVKLLGGIGVANWNNHTARDAADAARVLRAAAQRAASACIAA